VRIHVEVLERYVVVGIWPLEQSLKDHKVVPRHETAFRDICDAKENGKLRTADARQVTLGCDCVNELVAIQKSAAGISSGILDKSNTRKDALFTVGDGLGIRVEGPMPALYLRFLCAHYTLDALNDARTSTSIGIPRVRVQHRQCIGGGCHSLLIRAVSMMFELGTSAMEQERVSWSMPREKKGNGRYCIVLYRL
jgi:hypothetical protein